MRIVTNINKLHQKSVAVAVKDISRAFSKLLTRTIHQRKGGSWFCRQSGRAEGKCILRPD